MASTDWPNYQELLTAARVAPTEDLPDSVLYVDIVPPAGIAEFHRTDDLPDPIRYTDRHLEAVPVVRFAGFDEGIQRPGGN